MARCHRLLDGGRLSDLPRTGDDLNALHSLAQAVRESCNDRSLEHEGCTELIYSIQINIAHLQAWRQARRALTTAPGLVSRRRSLRGASRTGKEPLRQAFDLVECTRAFAVGSSSCRVLPSVARVSPDAPSMATDPRTTSTPNSRRCHRCQHARHKARSSPGTAQRWDLRDLIRNGPVHRRGEQRERRSREAALFPWLSWRRDRSRRSSRRAPRDRGSCSRCRRSPSSRAA